MLWVTQAGGLPHLSLILIRTNASSVLGEGQPSGCLGALCVWVICRVLTCPVANYCLPFECEGQAQPTITASVLVHDFYLETKSGVVKW